MQQQQSPFRCSRCGTVVTSGGVEGVYDKCADVLHARQRIADWGYLVMFGYIAMCIVAFVFRVPWQPALAITVVIAVAYWVWWHYYR